MKNLLKVFATCAALLCCTTATFAQQMPPIPVDQKVRIGKLENGLTYYIRHNEKPENRVEFYIAQKVGSILEEPQQRGLAHFLEHMAFNGTKNFPGDENGLSIVQWCESKGIKFGTNLNAYTSVDETVYNISNVPTEKEAVIDSCLLILHDWSNFILLKDEEIDKERGVIHEEWRSRNSGILRLYTEASSIMYKGSKYADCMPIGSIDVIDNFSYQTIRDYYNKWYRPDLQGIIVVGDIDVDVIEGKIKQTFSDIKKPENAADRIYYNVPDNEDTYIYIGKDKEVGDASFNIFFKHDVATTEEKGNMAFLVQRYVLNMISSMLNERFEEISHKADAPFTGAGVSYGEFFLAKTKDAFTASVESKPEMIQTALQALLTEIERARRFGFTEGEYQRAKANFLQKIETQYNERDKTDNRRFVRECQTHFLDGEPMAGIEFEYTFFNQIVPNIPLQAINQTIPQLITEKNQVVMMTMPDKEGIKVPTQDEVLVAIKGMKDLQVEAYVDQVSNEPLIAQLPKPGKIKSEKPGKFGTTEFVLDNGVKVYVKKTDFEADKIRMSAVSFGGSSLFEPNDLINTDNFNDVISLGGVGNFTLTELNKALAGKNVDVNLSLGNTQEGLNGHSSVKDFETLMQLTYLSFTAPHKDREAFDAFVKRTKTQLEAAQANPLSTINDTILLALYGNHPRNLFITPEKIDELNYDRVFEIHKNRFGNAGDFTFIIVGNIDLETARPLIAQYLGALPGKKHTETFRDNKHDILPGIRTKEYAKEQQTPMASNIMVYSGNMDYTLRNQTLMSVYSQTMRMVFTEEIREKEGGTYGVSCSGILSHYPKADAILQIFYQTDPDKKEHLNQRIEALVKASMTDGPTADHLQKAKEYMLKTFKDNQKENSYWMNVLEEYITDGIDLTENYEALVNSISIEDVKNFAAGLLSQNNKVTVIMTTPKK